MISLNETHRRIIDAVVQKAQRECPGSLALIGVYGSAATGDVHAKSDLDLLILINDEKGYRLCEGFLLEDIGVGYDLYCTSWAMLESDAQCGHPHLSKLLDSPIVYVGDPAAEQRLEQLRAKAKELLASDARFEKAQGALDEAKKAYADCFLAEDLGSVRSAAGEVIYFLLNALMLHGGRYFRRGVKRTFEETAQLELPFDLERMVFDIICAKTADALRIALTQLLREAQAHFAAPVEKAAPNGDALAGTYEEMYSNWRNKMYEAAQQGDVYSSFMNLLSMRNMLMEIGEEADIGMHEFADRFDPDDLPANARLFDEILALYHAQYEKAGVRAKRYANVEAFSAEYLKNRQTAEE